MITVFAPGVRLVVTPTHDRSIGAKAAAVVSAGADGLESFIQDILVLRPFRLGRVVALAPAGKGAVQVQTAGEVESCAQRAEALSFGR